MIKLDAKKLRLSNPDPQEIKKLPRNEIVIIVDNVLDTYNIGSIFRLADAVAAKKVYLCGDTETPPNHRIKKASINTTEWVPWEYKKTAIEAIEELRKENKEIKIYAVEQNETSVPYDSLDYKLPVGLVIGHETTGVTNEAMEAVDAIVEMPMWGVNISLNVMVSLGIMLYKVMESSKQKLLSSSATHVNNQYP
ncbi:MAG: TrmH family RNA methyltransferase [Patescibacteria group bacterium]